MARKFFNEKISSSQKTVIQLVIILVCIVGVIICFFLASYFNKNNLAGAHISMRDSVSVEINTTLPDKATFFTELEGVQETDINIAFDRVDLTKIGEYPVVIKIYKQEYQSKVVVVDTMSPNLEVKDFTINPGDKYKPEDFIKSCSDNSNENCNIDFYSLATTQDGEKIDYSSYTNVGSYKVQVVAKDTTGNITVKTAKLIIGNGNSTNPSCKYGGSEYDSNESILAVDVTQDGCALDVNLYQDSTILEAVNTKMDNETDKLKKEFSKLNVQGSISLNRKAVAIRNVEQTGIIGYSIYLELSVTNNSKSEVIESFYLDKNGKRIYSVNKYNLQ